MLLLDGLVEQVRHLHRRRDGIPNEKRASSSLPRMHRSHQVTATAEAGADESMHGQESLCRPGSFAPAQVSRAVPCGLMGDFSARWCAYRSVRWATDGRTARGAALSLRSVSVTTRPGGRAWTRISRTSPS